MVLHGIADVLRYCHTDGSRSLGWKGEFSTSTSFVLVTSGLCLQPRTSTCITILFRLSISLVKLPKANPQVGARNPVLPPAPFVRFFRPFVLSFWPSVGLLEERCLNLLDGWIHANTWEPWSVDFSLPPAKKSCINFYIMQNHGWRHIEGSFQPGTWM